MLHSLPIGPTSAFGYGPLVIEVKMKSCFALMGLALALLAGFPAVAHAQTDDETYQAVARQAYVEAMESFDDGDYIDAARMFNAIRARFPYSQFATLSDLRLGDVYYEQDRFASAIEQYRGFVKLHPNHEKVVYAAYRVALSFYGQMPEDWFFLPPAFEKDLSKTRDAERELRYFIARHPKSEYTAEARRFLARTRRQLADHEFYVADFYLRNDNPRGAAMRLTNLLDKYSGLGLDPQALFLLGRAYLELKDTKKAKAALEDLIEFHSSHPLAESARDYLASNDL